MEKFEKTLLDTILKIAKKQKIDLTKLVRMQKDMLQKKLVPKR